MTDQEMLDAMKALLTPINKRLDNMDIKMSEIDAKISGIQVQIDTLRLDMKSSERAIRKDIHYLNDSMETLVEVLEAKDILPRVK